MPPYNGSGSATGPAGGSYPAVAGTLIDDDKHNLLIADILVMLSTCLLKDGQQTATLRIPFAAGISTPSITTPSGTITITGNITLGSTRVVVTQAAGEVQGAELIHDFRFTATGHADGTADPRFFDVEPTVSGANNFSGASGIVSHIHHAGSGTIAAAGAFSGSPRIESSGSITAATAFNGAIHLIAGTGNITTGIVFQAKTQTMTGSGVISNLYGFRSHDISHARVTNAYCFSAEDQTSGASSLMVGFKSSLASGTGKWNLYVNGTAPSYFGSPLRAVDGLNSAPPYSFNSDPDTGFYWSTSGRVQLACNGVEAFRWVGDSNNAFDILHASASVRLGNPVDTILIRDAANTLALRNSTNAQEIRVYGTTTGLKHLKLRHDGTDGIVDTGSASGKLKLAPTNATDIEWGKALVALGGGAAPTLGTIGGSGPTVAAQNSWMRVLDSTGAAFWVAAWK